jgi:hypothetical protein
MIVDVMKRKGEVLLFLLFSFSTAGGNPLIEQAWEAGELDAETAFVYQIHAVRSPELLPVDFREGEVIPRCGTPMIQNAIHTLAGRSGDFSGVAMKVLARPFREQSHISPGGHFRIHFDLSGRNAIEPTDENENGLPDYVDAVAAVADSLWLLEIDRLGYRVPPADGGLGEGSECDIYISELPHYGFTHPDIGRISGKRTASYIEIDNNYTDPVFYEPGQTPGLDGLRVTLAHELFHVIQWGYYYGNDSLWWQEATATWMEEIAYPHIDNYLIYVPYFLRTLERGLDRGGGNDLRIYGISLFSHFLSQRYGGDIVRESWEEFQRRGNGRVENLERVVHEGLGKAMSEFAVWNYFTGERYRPDLSYEDGEDYIGLRPLEISTPAKTVIERDGALDHLSSYYAVLRPGLQSGGVRIRMETGKGRWQKQILLVDSDNVDIQVAAGDEIQVADWDRYDEVVVVLTVVDSEGWGFEYELAVEYDPELLSDAIPIAFRLGQNYPNPFRVGRQDFTLFPFELHRPSHTTRLSIFDLQGHLVRQFDLGGRAARRYERDEWDGRNAVGELVGSGSYFYLLEADGHSASRTMAIVRE